MKKILLYGVTGRTGQLVAEYALEKGYHVVALVRNPDKLTIKSDRLTVVEGSPANINYVKKAIQNCDAVISTLAGIAESDINPFKKIKPPHIMETAIRNTIQCMNEAGIKRMITLSSIGVGNSYKYTPWFMRLGIKLTNLKISFADHNAQESLLMSSDLDWVIIRPVGLNNNDKTKKLCIDYDSKPASFSISRKQVAQFMVDSLNNDKFVHKAPILSEA